MKRIYFHFACIYIFTFLFLKDDLADRYLPDKLSTAYKKRFPPESTRRHRNTMASNRKWVELGDGPMRVCVIKGDLTTEQVNLNKSGQNIKQHFHMKL